MRLTGTSSYKPVEIFDYSTSTLGWQDICYSSSIDSTTVNKLCNFGQYGDNSYGYKSSTSSGSSSVAIWRSIDCPSSASSVSSCSTPSGSYCSSQLTINCYPGSTSSSGSGSNYSPSSTGFPVAAVVVPLVWIVIVVVIIIIRKNQQQRNAANVTTVFSNTNNASSSSATTNYQPFSSSPAGVASPHHMNFAMSPVMAGGMGSNNVAGMYPGTNTTPMAGGYAPPGGYLQQNAYGQSGVPVRGSPMYGGVPPPPPPPPAANFAATQYGAPPGMTTFDNVHQTNSDNIPPPPGGYNNMSYMPGFAAYPPPPPSYQGVPPS